MMSCTKVASVKTCPKSLIRGTSVTIGCACGCVCVCVCVYVHFGTGANAVHNGFVVRKDCVL